MTAKIAIVTGASAGIGAAVARLLAAAGYRVIAGARRLDRLRAVTEPIGAEARQLDVTVPESVEAFASGIGPCHLLVNNAGLALGTSPVSAPEPGDWRTMFETNVMGVLAMTRRFLPDLIASGDGHVINIGSIAGLATYPGGGGYTASKHALRALTETLRQELLGQPVRITDIAPGLVETEFSLVRFAGDAERARAVYQGMTPLRAEDVAECVVWAASRPPHVNIDRIQVMPRDQASATQVHRRREGS